ncbi:DUF1707 SHOCT-like domain-containing protein [Saccharothrix lopnurensis]|uniref:DUF1707 domain-containing protein n=1 Tax=Saccharothrix lopnurensis TaxID=1670621 RepID=A0ABW1P192_9PSEU
MTESHFKAADDDRGVVVARLAKAHAEGRLTRTEFDERSRAVQDARSYAELRDLTADLPDPDRGPDRGPSPADRDRPLPGGAGGDRPEPLWQSRPVPVQDDPNAAPVWRSAPVDGQEQAGSGRPAPVWQDASTPGGRDDRDDRAADAKPTPVWQDGPAAGGSSGRAPAGARIGPDAHADRDPGYDRDTGYDQGTGYGAPAGTGYAPSSQRQPQRPRREPPPVPEKRGKATVFLTVLTVVWLFASAINLLIWGIINGTSETSVYPWWLWVAGPLGIVVLTAHLVRFGLRR